MRSGIFLLISLIVHVCEIRAQAPKGVAVSTFEELGEAFATADVQVVEIRQHLRGAQSMVLPSKQRKIVVGNCAVDTPREAVVFDEIFRQPYYHPRQCVIDFAGEPGFEVGVDSALWLTDLVIVDANRGEGQVEQFPKASQSAPSLPPAPRPSSVGLSRRLLLGSRGLLNAPEAPPRESVQPTDLANSGGALKAGVSSRAYVSRVLFYANGAHNGGAAAFEESSFGSFQNCTFLYNDASGLGGALFLDIAGKADVASSVFDGDVATTADSAYVGFEASLRLDVTCQTGNAACYTAPAVTFENIPGLRQAGVVYIPQGAASGQGFQPLKDAPSPFHPPNEFDTEFTEFIKPLLPREPAGLIAAAVAAPVVDLRTAPRLPVQRQAPLDASPVSLEASNLGAAPPPGSDAGGSGGRKRSVWDRHKAAFIPLIVVCCLSVAAIAFFMFKIRGLTPREDFGDLSEPPTDTTNGRSSADPNSLPPEISPASNTSIFSSFTLQSDGSEVPGIAAARSTLSSLTVKSFKERSVELWQYGAAAAAAAGAAAAGAATAASAAASSAAAGWRDEGTAAVELAPASLQDDDDDSRGRLGQQPSKESTLAEMNGHAGDAAARGGATDVSAEADVDADATKPSPKVVGGTPKSLRSSRRGAAIARPRSSDDVDESAAAAVRAVPSLQPESTQPAAPASPPAGAVGGGPSPSSPVAADVAPTPAAVASAPRSLRSGRSQRSAAALRSGGDAVDAEAATAAAEAAAAVAAAAAPPPPAASILDTGGAEQQQSLLDNDIEDPFQPAPGPPSAAPAQPTYTPEPPTAVVPEPPSQPEAPPASIPMYDPASFSGGLAASSNAGGAPTQRSPPPASEQPEGDVHSPDDKEKGDDFAGNRTRGGGEGSEEGSAEGEGTQRTRKWSRRGVLEKARRPNKFDPKKTDAASSSGDSERGDSGAAPSAAAASPFAGRTSPGTRSPPPSDVDAAAAQPRLPLMAEAAALGEVEKMPQDLEGASSGPLSARGNSGPFPNNKLRASSWHMAKEVKQSRRNRKLAAQKGMLNRGEAPAAQLFKISEQAEIRYTNNGLLYEVPADEVASNPSSANSQPLGSGSARLASRSARIDEEGSDEEPPSERMTDTSPL